MLVEVEPVVAFVPVLEVVVFVVMFLVVLDEGAVVVAV